MARTIEYKGKLYYLPVKDEWEVVETKQLDFYFSLRLPEGFRP